MGDRGVTWCPSGLGALQDTVMGPGRDKEVLESQSLAVATDHEWKEGVHDQGALCFEAL